MTKFLFCFIYGSCVKLMVVYKNDLIEIIVCGDTFYLYVFEIGFGTVFSVNLSIFVAIIPH